MRNFFLVNCVVVDDNRVGHPELVDNIEEEFHGLLGLDLCDWSDFDPLRELVDGDEHTHVASERFIEGLDHV